MEHFVAIFFRCSLLSNVSKYSKSSPMMSSFQDNSYVIAHNSETSECTASKPVLLELAHPKTFCLEYQAILSISS